MKTVGTSENGGPLPRASCIYSGHIRHRRFLPVTNAFRYRIFLMYVDLDELPGLFDGVRFWSVEKPNLASFHRRYYFGDPAVPLADAVRGAVREKLGLVLDGPVRLLTHFRYVGYCYNPVSFYYCFDATGQEVRAIVAEITNTPWGERHAYFLDPRDSRHPQAGRFKWEFPKIFHVSPFMPMNVMYDWRFNTPSEALNIHMIDRIDGAKYFDATLTLKREELSPRALTRVLIGYPALTTKVLVGIHWQALRLWLKRTPFYEHPGRAAENRLTRTATRTDNE